MQIILFRVYHLSVPFSLVRVLFVRTQQRRLLCFHLLGNICVSFMTSKLVDHVSSIGGAISVHVYSTCVQYRYADLKVTVRFLFLQWKVSLIFVALFTFDHCMQTMLTV